MQIYIYICKYIHIYVECRTWILYTKKDQFKNPSKVPSVLQPADTFKATVPRSHAAEEGFPWTESPPRTQVGMDPLKIWM